MYLVGFFILGGHMASEVVSKRDQMNMIANQLAPFIAKSKQSVQVTEHDAPVFLQSMREGLLAISELMTKAQYSLSKSKIEKERIESVLRIEKFPEWAAEKNLQKATEKDKQAFICIQPEYQMAQEDEAYWESVYSYLSSVRSVLSISIDDVKKNIYGRTNFNNINIRA
jgi:hypothetical protein